MVLVFVLLMAFVVANLARVWVWFERRAAAQLMANYRAHVMVCEAKRMARRG